MPTPLYALLLFRTDGTVLTGFGSTSDIFNADHLNHVTHTAAPYLNSWEEDVAQMQLTSAPTTAGGALLLPTVLKDEIERLRYEIARIKQQISGAATPPFWYTPVASFTDGIQLAPTAGRLELAAAQSFEDNEYTNVAFDVTVYLNGGMQVQLRRFVAPVAGVYICGGTIAFELTGVRELVLQIRSTLGTNRILAAQTSYSTTSFVQSLTVETVKHLNVGEALLLTAKQQSGVAQVPVQTTDQRPAMWIALVGRDT